MNDRLLVILAGRNIARGNPAIESLCLEEINDLESYLFVFRRITNENSMIILGHCVSRSFVGLPDNTLRLRQTGG